MTSRPVEHIMTIHIWQIYKQIINLIQNIYLIEFNIRNISKNHTIYEAGRLAPFFFFKKKNLHIRSNQVFSILVLIYLGLHLDKQ